MLYFCLMGKKKKKVSFNYTSCDMTYPPKKGVIIHEPFGIVTIIYPKVA